MSEEKRNRTPEEQEAAFKAWLQNKTLRDTAFSYLERLDPVHAVEEENLKQVAVALKAAEVLLGDSGGGGGGGGDDYGDSEAAPKVRYFLLSRRCHPISTNFLLFISLFPCRRRVWTSLQRR